MNGTADPHGGLMHALNRRFHAAGLTPILESSRSERWASITFAGTRHSFNFACAALAGDDRVDALAHELKGKQIDLPDHLVADIALLPGSAGFTIDALTVEVR